MIKLNNVYKAYTQGDVAVQALMGLDLSVAEGDFLAIMGPSGSGKSTLMNILGCLDIPDSGEYMLHGQRVDNMSRDELAIMRNHTIGFVFQSFNLLESLNALQNVELPLFYRGILKEERRDMARNMLIKMGLGNRMSHRPSELSGGQRQRVAIARALVTNPNLILADEPTGNLDAKAGDEILDILSSFNDCGTTIVLITHELNIAKAAKNILYLSSGKLVREA